MSLERFFVIVAVLVATGCGAKQPPAFFDKPLPLLTWMGEFTRPTGTVYPQIADSSKFGSISGLAPDVGRQQWVGVIDDREHSRVAWLNVNFGSTGLEIVPVRMQELTAAAGVESRRVTDADLESIVALPNGNFVIGEEGHVRDGMMWQPAL
ncbi:MAG TPA: esterase-like activity of phytase family protein, partial [Vicinamibacterales bacterium]|nr:esterase-like activity of phytase family protein [Vicinamibacterales bacterium]